MARLCAVTAAVLVCALLPGSAQAGTAGLVDLPQADGSTIRAMLFVADPGETNSTELSYDAGVVTIGDTLAGGVRAGDGCVDVVTAGSHDVRCPTGGVQLAVLALGDGDDVQSIPNLDRAQRACPIPLYVDAGDGDDVVVTCRDADTLAELGAGDDRLYVGTSAAVDARLGDGDDVVATFDGASFGSTGAYDGGAGDDLLIGTTAKETFTGGPGRDRVAFPLNRVDANLDGQAADSPEGDHVLGDVEELAASVVGSTISGNDGPNVLVSGGPGVTLRGLGGDDVLLGSDYGERLDGGAGEDRITGGFGDDAIDPGPGRDTVDADRQADDGFAAGNDAISARDGAVDRIGCNIGADTATVDAADVTDACERVARAAGGGAGAGGGATIAGVSVARSSLRDALRSGLRLRIRTRKAARLQLVARHGGRVVARGTATTRAGRVATVRLRIDRSARQRLSRARRATFQITVRAGGGSRSVQVTLGG